MTGSAFGRTIGGIALLFVGLLAGSAGASDATPISFDTNPARCTIEPRTLADLEHILDVATPAASIDTPTSGTPIALDSHTGKTVTSTIETLFACLNAGDRLRAYALYTDDYLATILQPGDLPAVATPQPADADEYTAIIAIEPRQLSDGRVFAQVTLDPALIPVHKVFGFILIPVDDGWRIDHVINEIDFSLP